jgi:C_GCAxxG_C_C family probable redox protein
VEKAEHALERFASGLNCSQAVVGEFAEDLGLDLQAACRVACGFGGGMGGTGGTCGTVTGAIMVIGLAACGPDPTSLLHRARIDDLVQAFVRQFESKHDSTLCRDLLGCDISSPDGKAQAARLGLFDSRCRTYVKDAVEILEEML